jgi:hypothetical protein
VMTQVSHACNLTQDGGVNQWYLVDIVKLVNTIFIVIRQ